MIDITFNRDGSVKVFAMDDGAVVSVTAPANKLPELLPATVYEGARARMAELLDIWTAAKPATLRAVRS